MAKVDFSARQLTVKLVYFGPPLSGKTTNLRVLHERVAPANRGDLMTLDTRDDRTLFFDLLPMFFRSSGISLRLRIYTVPGQVMHEVTRRVVLQGADGVVFVADSSRDKVPANRASWVELVRDLDELGGRVPVVVQYNKRDLPGALALDAADRFDDDARVLYPARAVTGHGVLETFFAALDATWGGLERSLRLEQRFGLARDAFLHTVRGHVDAGDHGIVAR